MCVLSACRARIAPKRPLPQNMIAAHPHRFALIKHPGQSQGQPASLGPVVIQNQLHHVAPEASLAPWLRSPPQTSPATPDFSRALLHQDQP